MSDHQDLETKASGSPVGSAFEEFMRAFESFKETNDERLAEIERRSQADPLLVEKVARIDRALDEHKRIADELALKAARPHLGGNTSLERSSSSRALTRAFEGYVRKGDATPLRDLEAKSLSVGSSPDGGYLVPPETERTINAAVKAISPIRSIAAIRQISASVYKKPFQLTDAGTGWVGETAARPETTSPTLAELTFPAMELYAMPAASSTLLDDSAVDIDEWIAEEVRATFAKQEGIAFISGNGTNKPRGFLDYTKVANAAWTWGNMGYLATGVAGALPASNPGDKLIDLIYAVKSEYRASAAFVFSRSTQALFRKLKDDNGNYLWTPPTRAGEQSSLMGFPVVEAEDMPDVATDSYAMAFGDFRRGYLIVDRVGIRVLRDPYSSKPYVLFYTTKRVGGGVQDFDAIKLLKFGVS
ncbi:MAG: phage major capsid protein [Hyphomicrobium sp.]|jgi:HK97 family phage major capsid protein